MERRQYRKEPTYPSYYTENTNFQAYTVDSNNLVTGKKRKKKEKNIFYVPRP